MSLSRQPQISVMPAPSSPPINLPWGRAALPRRPSNLPRGRAVLLRRPSIETAQPRHSKVKAAQQRRPTKVKQGGQIRMDQKALLELLALLMVLLVGADKTPSASEPSARGFTNYVEKIPGTTAAFELVAIPGGTLLLGSSPEDANRELQKTSARQVTLKPFWMARCEVSWAEYVPYVFLEPSEVVRDEDKIEGVVDRDGISHPSKPYGSIYRGYGEKGYPAIGMSLRAATHYCLWLSKKTGRHYRLPMEAEWEYACRAGAVTEYFWGQDSARAQDYAWFKDNSGDPPVPHPIGKLKPNPFGLYDIVGNVAEWCAPAGSAAPHVARGGSFEHEAAQLRCAARLIETPEWSAEEPESPRAIWWLRGTDFVGFRVVRSADDTHSLAPPPQ
jgi:formylglycine-generating enzyme required for sulfatase activity